MKLSLVIPCYNEEKNVRLFHDVAKNVFDKEGYSYELVFVNDGSADGTLEQLKALHAQSECNIRIVSFSRNFGKEAAMFAGLQNARGDLVCLIDADLQQRPEIVADMVKMLDADSSLDCVAAFQEQRHEGSVLSFFKNSFYKLINAVSDVKMVQGASDFRTFRRNVVDAILSMGEYHRFSKGILAWVGFNTRFIPYNAEERANGESKWSFKKLFKYAVDGIIGYSTAPLAVPTVLGVALIVITALMFVYNLIGELLGYGFDGVKILAMLIMLMTAAVLISLGIIGKYLAKTYEQGKKRPIYIAKEIIEPKEKSDE